MNKDTKPSSAQEREGEKEKLIKELGEIPTALSEAGLITNEKNWVIQAIYKAIDFMASLPPKEQGSAPAEKGEGIHWAYYGTKFKVKPAESKKEQEGEIVDSLTDFVNAMKTNQTLLNGCDIETIHIPSLLHKIKEMEAKSQTREADHIPDTKKMVESDAVEFVDWIEKKGFWFDADSKLWRRGLGANWDETHTTPELYQLFKSEK